MIVINTEIVADSVNPDGDRITSFLLTYPRFIHSELMTHRAFSRNSASSRAIPLKTMLAHVDENPATPVFWAENQKGMQASSEIKDVGAARIFWIHAKEDAIEHAKDLGELSLHKAICNRLIEPFAHMTTLVTATDYQNFFALRAHPDAQQEFQVLAYRMLGLYLVNKPAEKKWGEWHLPYRNPDLDKDDHLEIQLKISVARACRTSYTKFFGDFSVEDDCALHDSALAKKHMSTFEHPAQARAGRWANFTGWQSYRYMIPGENQTDVDLAEIYRNRPEWVDGAGL